jgi:hypothetical protein
MNMLERGVAMMESAIIVPKAKRFIPVATYARERGLSIPTVNHLCESGQINFITTESGQRRIDTREKEPEQKALYDRLESVERLLTALCRQFNIKS